MFYIINHKIYALGDIYVLRTRILEMQNSVKLVQPLL